ncbi:hypothetical protein C6P74_25620 [Burkholderia multivorans]|uniref:hypothetical protein n=1 Tax=Burkholderia multivorans TaxID=87883 RepID=UPI000CFFD633|nr:hypothetical protein [Burkholderia multivorans]MBU9574071.1 hypothetical protein [Burkholderia multivorans]PRD74952.1 hypothetical protein C6P74_25620 [Burkholderia multivorans]
MGKTAVAVFAAVLSMSALAFDVDGFRTGMTVNEVAIVVQNQGWTLGESKGNRAMRYEFHFDSNGKVTGIGPADFTFCDGRLIAYTRSLDFDTEYAPKLRELIEGYGNRPRIEVKQYPWNGQNGGYITSVRTIWAVGREFIELGFEPEEHSGDGSLKHYRGASLAYVLPNACK